METIIIIVLSVVILQQTFFLYRMHRRICDKEHVIKLLERKIEIEEKKIKKIRIDGVEYVDLTSLPKQNGKIDLSKIELDVLYIVSENISFEDLCDLDYFLNIAKKQRNIDYYVEILKSPYKFSFLLSDLS